MAYARSASGSDWQEIRVRRVDTGEEYPEVLRWVKFTNLAWTPDNQGFFYTRFPDPSMVAPEETSYYSKVCYHRIGTDQAADEVVYERPDAREFGFSADVSEDGRYIVITVWVGTDRKNRVYYRELGSDGPFMVDCRLGNLLALSNLSNGKPQNPQFINDFNGCTRDSLSSAQTCGQ